MRSAKSQDNLQAVYNILAQIILNGVNFALIMVFTRFLTQKSYGIVSLYQAYEFILSNVVGLCTYGSIGTAFVHIDEDKHDKYLSSIMFLSLLSFIVIGVISMFFMGPIVAFTEMSPLMILLMLAQSFGSFCFNFANVKYVYMRKTEKVCLLSLVVSGSMIVLSVLSLKYEIPGMPDYFGRVLSLAIPYILCAVFVMIIVFAKANPFSYLRQAWKFCLPISIPLVFHGVSMVFLSQTDKIMIQKLLLDEAKVGVYSMVITFAAVLNSLYMAFNNTWVPIFYFHLKEKRIEDIKERAENYRRLFSVITVCFVMGAPEVIKLLTDESYWYGISILPISSLTYYILFLYSFAVNYELYKKESVWIAIGTTATAVMNMLLNWLLIPRMDILGAAVATDLSYVMLLVFHEMCARRLGRGTYPKGDYPFKKIFIVKDVWWVVAFCGLFTIISDLWYVRWGIALVIGIIRIVKITKNKLLF